MHYLFLIIAFNKLIIKINRRLIYVLRNIGVELGIFNVSEGFKLSLSGLSFVVLTSYQVLGKEQFTSSQ
jgi:hypothetical protein